MVPPEAGPFASPAPVLVLYAELAGVEPPIWRRLAVRADATLADLHDALQIAFDWDDEHLHEFQCRGGRYGPEDLDDADVSDEFDEDLGDVLPRRGTRLRYVYDFGDGWEVRVHVEQVEDAQPDRPPPPLARILGGARAAPPEDCGGVSGYLHLLEVSADPDHPDRDDVLASLDGEPYDGEAFDAARIADRLASLTGLPTDDDEDGEDDDEDDDEDGDEDGDDDEEEEEDDDDDNGLLDGSLEPLDELVLAAIDAEFVYDADRDPDPEAWTALDEDTQSFAIQAYHQRGALPVGENGRLHVMTHLIVEKALATDTPPAARRALARLRRSGLSRHDALHLLAGVWVEYIHRCLARRKPSTWAELERDLDRL